MTGRCDLCNGTGYLGENECRRCNDSRPPYYDEAVQAASRAIHQDDDYTPDAIAIRAIDAALPIIEAGVRAQYPHRDVPHDDDCAMHSCRICGEMKQEARADERRQIVEAFRAEPLYLTVTFDKPMNTVSDAAIDFIENMTNKEKV